jgi:hypothetical protein
MSICKAAFIAAGLAATTLTVFAQPTYTTCTAAPTAVQALNIERVVPLTAVLTTYTPRVDPAVAASVQAGAQELHQAVTYNARLNSLTVTLFLTAAKAPVPTPPNLINIATVDTYSIAVNQVYTSCTPVPSVLFVGTVASSGRGPLGATNGALAAVGVGYTTDATPKVNNVTELHAGLATIWTADAQGTIAFPASTTPGGGTNGMLKIVTTPAPPATGFLQVFQNRLIIDASGSTGAGLTYEWTSDKNIRFQPSNTVARPTLVFNSGQGNYKATLTVTDSSGATATTTFNITFFSGRL